MKLIDKNKCSYEQQCENEAFKNRNNDLYYCHKHNTLNLLEELEGNILTDGDPMDTDDILWYIKETQKSVVKIR